jgi:hypothetical protein
VPAGAAAAGDLNRVGGGGLVKRRQRHRLRGGHRRQPKTQAKNGNSKQFHDKFFLSKIAAMRRFRNYATIGTIW